MNVETPTNALPPLKFDAAGLIAALAQDHLTGDVLMVGWMNQSAVDATLRTGRATFFSRSRQRLWVKGETSGHFLNVHSVHVDCDADTLLLRVSPAGPACHTGQPTCFFREVNSDSGVNGDSVERPPPATFLQSLEREIAAREQSTGDKSYTRALLDGGAAKIGAKLREEAAEVEQALASESAERVANEAADLLYHLMVGLRLRGVGVAEVLQVLATRAGVSGHAEKAARKI